MSPSHTIALGCLALFSALEIAGAQPAQTSSIGILSFRPQTGTLQPGEAAVSSLTVFNSARLSQRVWIGYSVENPDGTWLDAPAHPITLGPGATTSHTHQLLIPAEPRPVPGSYRVVMAVWTEAPGTNSAKRLATADKRAAFLVHWKGSLVDEPPGLWQAAQHRLGRGLLRREHVLINGAEGFRLQLPAASCDGAEVRTSARYHFGEYSARMKVPNAPGSLSALFLYADVSGGNDEIDIEIYNDGSRKALITAWIAGKMTRSAHIFLPFDPAARQHDYKIRWTQRELVMWADDFRLAGWTSGFPLQPMRAIVNVWWPAWLRCDPLPSGQELSVEWIRLRPFLTP